MKLNEISRGLPVVVGNLLRLANANTKSLMDCQPGETPPLLFKQDYVDKRRLRACGIVFDPPAGHQGSGVFVVEHDDGTRAVYHCSELVSAQSLAEATLADSDFRPQRRAQFRGTWLEVYVGVEAVKLSADVLIASLAAGTMASEQQRLPLHDAIRAASGEQYHKQLPDPGSMRPLTTLVAGAPESGHRPPFGNVLFINGQHPTWDAVDAALCAAHAAGGRTVVLPIRDFMVLDDGATDIDLDELLEMIDVVIDGRDLSFTCIKIVV